MKSAKGHPSGYQLGFSPRCRTFHDTLLSRIARNQLFESSIGGMAGDTLVYTKRGAIPVKSLRSGDFVLDQKNGGFVRILDVRREASGHDKGDIAVEVPSSDPLSPRCVMLHPAQPVLLDTVPSAKRIFGTDPVMLPALWAGPFLGAHLQTPERCALYRPIAERAVLMWTVERPVPCLGPDQRWTDLQPRYAVSSVELQKWLFLYSFRVEHFFRNLPVDRHFPPVNLIPPRRLNETRQSGSPATG